MKVSVKSPAPRIVDFSALCRDSGVFDPAAGKRISSAVAKSRGEAFFLVHPGFSRYEKQPDYLNKEPWDASLVSWNPFPRYMKALNKVLKTSTLPLFIFGEKRRPRADFDWVLSAAAAENVVFIDTHDESPEPCLGWLNNKRPFDELFDVLKDGLGIKHAVIAGELLTKMETSPGEVLSAGCVNGLFEQAINHFEARIEYPLTFPNLFYRFSETQSEDQDL